MILFTILFIILVVLAILTVLGVAALGAAGIVVFGDEIAAQFVRIFCRCLPQERCKVVVERTLSAALEIDERRVALGVEHDIACLEVAIEERVGGLGGEVFGEKTEVGLKLQLVKVEFRRFEKAVFEVIEVEEHALLIEFRLRIAVVPVEPPCATHLYVGQLAYGGDKEFLLLVRVSSASLASAFKGVEERSVAEVGLDVAQLVVARRKNLRHGELTLREMLRQIDEGMVLIATCSHHTYHRTAVVGCQTVVLTVAARPFEAFYTCRLGAVPRFIQFN